MASETTEWRGQTWYYYRDYYRNRDGKLLHREKYQDHHGPLGREFDVHHKDGDPLNNDLDNLIALTRKAHFAEHEPRGWNAFTSEQRREVSLKLWLEREARPCVCVVCGTEYQSTGMRARFCRPACAQQHWRDTHPGYHKRFRKPRPPKEPKVPKPRPMLQCVICEKDFPKPPDPRTQCCSRQCGYVLRSRRGASGSGA